MSESFGENLVKQRKKAGLSQEELAEKLEISRQTISKWETEASMPDAAYVRRLCEILGISADRLLFDTPDSMKAHKRDRTDVFYPFFYLFLLALFVAGVVMYLFNRWTMVMYVCYLYTLEKVAILFCALPVVIFFAIAASKFWRDAHTAK